MSSPKYLQKRVGYLGAVQSFRPDTEVLMLATNLLKKVWVIGTSIEGGDTKVGLGFILFIRNYHVSPYHNPSTYHHTFSGPLSPLRSTTEINAFTSSDSKEDDCDPIQIGSRLSGNPEARMAQNKGTIDG